MVGHMTVFMIWYHFLPSKESTTLRAKLTGIPFLTFEHILHPLDTHTEQINLMELSPPPQAIGKLHTTLISQSHIEEVSAEQIPPCHNT
jgi:hypothetical protein